MLQGYCQGFHADIPVVMRPAFLQCFSLYYGIRLTGDKPSYIKAYLLSLHSIGLSFVKIKSSLISSGAYLHP